MSRETLIARVFGLPEFALQLAAVTRESVRREFPGVVPDGQATLEVPTDWKYLLSCASLLAQSEASDHQDAALRIAQASLQLTASGDESLHVGGAMILDALSNNPALDLSIRRNLVPKEFADLISPSLRVDLLRRRFETSVQTEKELVHFTRFQSKVYRGALESAWLSVSAPTSAGKSFVLNRIIAHHLDVESRAHVVYMVPTRALIQQVMADLTDLNAKHGRIQILLSAMPQVPEDHQTRSCVFVLTQERMHWLLGQVPKDFKLDLLVVDEAQKIGDGARGILLQQVLESAVRMFPKLKVVFSSPLTTNPELLVEDVPEGRDTKYLSSALPTVNQNLVWASQKPGKPIEWEAFICRTDTTELLGAFTLPYTPNPESKRLPFVAFAMTQSARDGGCLLYVDTQSKAEKAAFQLTQLRGPAKESDPEINELIKLVKKIVHPSYELAQTLGAGVAFHYGNMPLVLRTEIERLFKKGKIRFLVCTSTLIEGVNLPAKFIFVRGPRKGASKPLGEGDFWNLAGRAGRLGTEFQGSVVCVDPTDSGVWKTPPPTKRTTYPMKRALDDVIFNHNSFLEFLDAEQADKKPQREQEFEHALVYCTQVLARGEALTAHAWAKRFPFAILQSVEVKVRKIVDTLSVSPAIIQRNAGVSPIALQRLLNFFRNYEEPIERLLPYPPEDPKAVEDSYLRLIGNMAKYLSGDPQALNYPRAILVVNWMRGFPLSRMINENINYWVPKGRAIPKIIRDTMDDVEQFARFAFVKHVACYIDVFSQHLAEIGRQDLVGRIPQLQLYAEFGASLKTQMSLMDIGLSRVAAIELSELILDTDLDRADCIEWLRENDLRGLTLSPILVREIEVFRQGIANNEAPEAPVA